MLEDTSTYERKGGRKFISVLACLYKYLVFMYTVSTNIVIVKTRRRATFGSHTCGVSYYSRKTQGNL